MGQAPFSSNYNPGWRNHPNFSWRDRDQGNNYQKPHNNQSFQGQGSGQQQRQEQGGGSGKWHEEVGGAARGVHDSHRECLQKSRSSPQGSSSCHQESGESIWPNGQAIV